MEELWIRVGLQKFAAFIGFIIAMPKSELDQLNEIKP